MAAELANQPEVEVDVSSGFIGTLVSQNAVLLIDSARIMQVWKQTQHTMGRESDINRFSKCRQSVSTTYQLTAGVQRRFGELPVVVKF